jgi:hypothetical protein
MKTKLLILLSAIATAAVMGTAFAETKQARDGDIASSYTLNKDGSFFRTTLAGTKCEVTNNITDFKVSQHPNDLAMAYFVKDGDLYVLNNVKAVQDFVKIAFGECPKTTKKLIVSSVDKYTVVSNQNTTVVNLTLATNGEFKAWDNNKAILTLSHINEYVNNECYGSKKASFSSYVAFAIDKNGFVYKIKGEKTESSKVSEKSYDSLKEFKKTENVCK